MLELIYGTLKLLAEITFMFGLPACVLVFAMVGLYFIVATKILNHMEKKKKVRSFREI